MAKKWHFLGLIGVILVMAVTISIRVHATANGKVGYSGNPATNGGQTCTVCHTGGSTPDVSLTGPTAVLPGVTNLYQLTIDGGPAQTGGFNVSINSGDLVEGTESRLETGELTHTWPPLSFDLSDQATFTFAWTAPDSDASETMYGAGVSSNDQFNTDGDGVETDTLAISVADTRQKPSEIELDDIIAMAKVTDITHAGDDRLFIVEQTGRIHIYGGGTILATPYLNITTRVHNGGEMGLLGLAFHPDYATNGYFFVNYTTQVSETRTTRVSRFSVDDNNANLADSTSELILLEFSQTYSNHNGGAIHFGPDGYLYIAVGDGGSANDPDEESQDLSSLLGNMLRIDVDVAAGNLPDCDTSGNSNYRIPPDNPFVDGTGGVCDEIWAAGMRNPWRFSFDRDTGDLWIADVGQWAWEEIDFEPAGFAGGRNYGWDCYEGNSVNTNDPSPACTGTSTDYDFPVFEYQHVSGRCSITGGYVYRGVNYGGLLGHYLYGDYCTSELWTLSGDPTNPVSTDLSLASGSTLSRPRTFGEDANGELYVADDTKVYRIQDGSAGPVAPASTIVAGSEAEVTLTWADDVANCSYEVHAGTAPYFSPDGLGTLLHVIPGGETTEYSIPFATGDPDTNHFYTVRAINCSGLMLADSETLGEFDWTLMPGS